MRRALVLLATIACGSRTGLSGELPNANDGGGVDAGLVSTPYKVVYEAPITGGGFELWRSTSMSLAQFSGGIHFQVPMSCTYDGRFVAAADNAALSTFEVLDATGVAVRTQNGSLEALRPDGMRAIVAGVDGPCVGTLDADGTYLDVHCSNTNADYWTAVAYAPDGKTVLWARSVYDVSTTDTDVTFATASEQLTNQRVVVAPSPVGRHVVAGPSFSFDGARLAYADCRENYGEYYCRLETVRLDTLQTTALLDDGQPRFITAVGFTPDGAGLVYLESQLPVHPPALRYIDLATGAETTLADPSHADAGLAHLCVARDVP